MASNESKTFIKYLSFIFVFIVSFFIINIKSLEIFGLGLFFVVNLLFCMFIGKDLTDGSISAEGRDTEWTFRYASLIFSVIFSFVSSIMMIMTLFTLQSKFGERNSEIKWSPHDRISLDNAEITFITITVFIGVAALYVYNSPENIRKLTYNLFDSILNNSGANWLRVIFPILIIVLGSVLYGTLHMSPLEVNKTPKRVVCDPLNDGPIQEFKDSFIKTYWFCFAFAVVILIRPFIEANFSLFGISPSAPLGFSSGDRSFVFGQNPSIRLISLLTLGLSDIAGINRRMEQYAESKNSSPLNKSSLTKTIWSSIANLLLMPVLRWDSIYLLAKYALGLAGLIYAGFSIKQFNEIPGDNPCLYSSTYIRQLYIAFIFLLIVFYMLNTLSPATMTYISTGLMRYAVPPTLLGLSSYLVFITNSFVHMAPKLVVN